ncbi:MAG: FtsX-like permease family protein [Planctomycetota bacterium]|nr:FtsX-like permease family protein [Planctomycetota bacterium]
MYKLMLAWRYLRTRYIALASIVSVTLGVATLVVVNSVMSGFTHEMHKRLHGILSDMELMSPGLGEIYEPRAHIEEIRRALDEDLEALSAVVRVPALLHQTVNGRMITQQIILMGIDDQTYSHVSDFTPYLLNEQNRKQPDFQLKKGGYDGRLGEVGWPYRTQKAEFEREQRRLLEEAYGSKVTQAQPEVRAEGQKESEFAFVPIPVSPPVLSTDDESGNPQQAAGDLVMPQGADPFKAVRESEHTQIFDPATQQHPGIILGMALANRKFRDPETGDVRDVYINVPGDDIQITLPTGGSPPRPTFALCTVVDFYESKMHEYDSTLAFMPLSELQKIRQMFGPDGEGTVSSIQIKLKPGADLEAAKEKLVAMFPPDIYPYQIQTWKDVQRPLLAAVQLEITILNILLFLIIAVAGFGILATFFMIVVEKTKDIGILKALGAPSRGVMSIFLSYGLSLGFVGAGAGIVLGLLFVSNINEIAGLVERLTGREVFDPTIYYFSEIPTIIDPYTVVWIAVGAMGIAVLASVLPARHAAKLHPVEALRYE